MKERHVETWARHIKKVEDYVEIPSDIRLAYEANTGRGYDAEIYMIYCPPDERAGEKISEKLLYICNSSLICIEKGNQGLTVKQFRTENIEVMEIGFVLLDAWIIIAGKNGDKDEIITVYYNQVVYLFFEKLIGIMRALALGIEYPPQYDNAASLSLQDMSYNFMNYTHSIILKNESPAEYVFQQAITGKRFKIFPITYINSHILMLTKSELIQINEGRQRSRGKTDNYGHTNTFYILRHINRPEYYVDEDFGHLNLNITAGAYRRSVLFDKDNMSDALALVSKL